MRERIVGFLVFISLVLVALFFFPWRLIDWGKIQLAPTSTITVIGTAQTTKTNQVASFTAGVSAVNTDKNTAINEVNEKINAIIQSVKDFGIPDADIKTQNLSVYQQQESFYEEGTQRTRPGQWNVNNSIEIKLRDVSRASDLANLLTQSGATNVYGPNLTYDDVNEAGTSLLGAAVEDARTKAEKIAQGSGRTLGKIISVAEGANSSPVYPLRLEAGGGGGGAPIEPGSSNISQSVTVVFELK